MGEMEEKLNGILNDPQMMQKIMSMAQSISAPDAASPRADALPNLDLGMIQKLSGIASQTGIDKNQQSLLLALKPYLSRERIGKLEKAMRAAKMARLASGFLGQQGPSI